MGMSQRQSRFDQSSNMGGPGGNGSPRMGGPPMGGMRGPPGHHGGHGEQQQAIVDGPMGRNPLTFGAGNQRQVPGNFFPNNGPPRPSDDVHKMNEVQKLLQTFKNDQPNPQQLQQRGMGQPLEYFMHNNMIPQQQQQQHPPGSLPNLINVMGPFANALTGGQGQPPRPPGGMPLPPTPLSDFQPAEKRIRR